MHQHHAMVADALVREREVHRQRNIHLTHHLSGQIRPPRPIRARLAVGLVRLARVVEPGAAAVAARRDAQAAAA